LTPRQDEPFGTQLPWLRPRVFARGKAMRRGPASPPFYGLGLVTAPCAAEVTRAAYLANTPVG
jgi:hypothetical protein